MSRLLLLRHRFAAAAGISAPTLAQTSSAGASPLTMSVTFDSTVFAGDSIELQIATDSGFVTVTQDITQFIDGSSWAAGDLTLTGFTTPSGAFWARCHVTRDDGAASAWSNAINDTISASVAIWTTTNGTKKHSGVTVSGSPALIMQGTTGSGATQGVAANIAGALKSEWELKLSALATDSNRTIVFGRYNGTTDLSAYNAIPGSSDSNGYSVWFNPGGTGFEIHIGGSAVYTTPVGSNNLLNDVWSDNLDTSGSAGTHTLQILRNGSSIVTLTGRTLTGFTRAWAAVQSDEILTANYGGSTFTNAGPPIYG